MIYHQLITKQGLLKSARDMADSFCKSYGLKGIPVYLKDFPGANGVFDDRKICIYISPTLTERYKKYTDLRAFYEFFRNVRHELEHYKDFVGGRPLRTRESERRADKVAILKATEALSKYTDTQINPLAHFRCSICGAEAPSWMLEHLQFDRRMSWLRNHYKTCHPLAFRRMYERKRVKH